MTRRVHFTEPHDICCMRPSPYGNPWSHKEGTLALYKVATRQESVEAFRRHLESNKELQEAIQILRDKTLACCCGPKQKCHVDEIIDFLNRDTKLEELFKE